MIDVEVVREIDPSARVSAEAIIGPYCVIGPQVTIGPRTTLNRRVSVRGQTTIGSDNIFAEGCVLGETPQDLKYKGHDTLLLIGHRNRFHRTVTVHIGTEGGGFITRIGDGNVFLDGAHIPHDCYVDNGVHLGRNVLLAGHIRVHDGAVIEDLAGLQHFVTVGKFARVGPRTPVRRDVPPYTNFYSENYDWADPPAVRGVHEAGIAAAKLSAEEEKELRRALQDLFADESALQTKIEQLTNMGVEGEVAKLCQFIQRSLRGVFGRHRELYRGKAPPEAQRYCPPELKSEIRRTLP
ncbi:MAG: LbetaH domain-containing protein [Planctomycetota bacterium]|jgi:UDP-N-acetylglucosamine acyltransferase